MQRRLHEECVRSVSAVRGESTAGVQHCCMGHRSSSYVKFQVAASLVNMLAQTCGTHHPARCRRAVQRRWRRQGAAACLGLPGEPTPRRPTLGLPACRALVRCKRCGCLPRLTHPSRNIEDTGAQDHYQLLDLSRHLCNIMQALKPRHEPLAGAADRPPGLGSVSSCSRRGCSRCAGAAEPGVVADSGPTAPPDLSHASSRGFSRPQASILAACGLGR